MARTPTPTPGARDAISDRAGNAGPGTDLPASTPVTNENAPDGSAATPPAQVPAPEPFNPEVDREGGAPAPGTGDKVDGVEMIDVETTGEFMLQDPYTLDIVEAEGTSSVRKTSYIDTAIADGRLKKAGE